MEQENEVIEEKANGWFVILSVLIPLAGLITFLCWKDSRPKTAKASGIAALISFVICSVILPLIMFVVTNIAAYNMIYGDGGINDKARAIATESVIITAEDDVELAIFDAHSDYLHDTYGESDSSVRWESYLNEAMQKVKAKVNDSGVSLTATGNTITLTYNENTVTGTVSDTGTVTWSK